MIEREKVLEHAKTLKAEGFTYFCYCAAVHKEEKIIVEYRVRRLPKDSVAFQVEVPVGESTPSLAGVWAGADWQEREQYDLVGVVFDGHPDLRRIMLPEDWEGHPLRRDYAIDTRCAPWR